MTAPAWMPFYVSDYLADTGHLNVIQHGAYLLLIFHYWQRGSLPMDDRQLAHIVRMDDETWSENREILATFFGRNWSHKRIEQELEKASVLIARRSSAGKAGASALHGKRMANAQQTHAPSPSQLQEPEEKKQKQGSAPVVADVPSPSAPEARTTLDPKTILFREGLKILAELTDRQPAGLRSELGKWMKITANDAGAILAEIERCRGSPVADPISWIEARLKPQKSTIPESTNGLLTVAREIQEALNGHRNFHTDTPQTEIRGFEAHANGGFGSQRKAGSDDAGGSREVPRQIEGIVLKPRIP